MRRAGFLLATAICVLMMSASASAAICIWNGSVDSNWDTAANWTGCTGGDVPDKQDDVLLNNSLKAGSYTVFLPADTKKVEVNTLTITPDTGNNILLTLPVTNLAVPALVVGDSATPGDFIILNSGAILRNSSGAVTGFAIEVNPAGSGTARINNGGRYIHDTTQSANSIVSKLSLEPGTETGIFEYDVPGTASESITANGAIYGSLVLTRTDGAATYTASGGSALTVRGDFLINPGVTYTSTMSGAMNVAGNFTNNGAPLTLPVTQAVNFIGTSNQTISGTGPITFDAGTTVNVGATVTLAREANIGAAHTFLVNGTLNTGTHLVSGPGIFTLSANGTLGIGSPAGITSSGLTGNIQTDFRNYSSAAKYTYNGTAAQVTGNGLPAVLSGALTISNSAGVTLSQDTTLNGASSVSSGATFNTGAFTLALGAPLTNNGIFNVSGTLTMRSGGSVNTNAPTYGDSSTLIYDCSCVYARSTEWSTTSGPGYPNDVQVNSGTDVNIGGSSPGTARRIAGSLNANGGRFLMDSPGSQMTASLTVLGDVIIGPGGSLHLSTVPGGDLVMQDDFDNSGTFMPNNRAVFFEGANTQTVSDISGTVTMPYIRINTLGSYVQLLSNLEALAPLGGDSIQFLTSTSSIYLNDKTLTLGSTVGTPPPGGGIISDNSSSLSLQDGGTGPGGPMGTIVFTSGDNALSTLTINRTGANGSVTLGTNLLVANTLNLTSGDVNTGANTLIMSDSATSTGNGDVVGNVRRTDLGSTARSFGNPNNQISFQTGNAPTAITVNLVKSQPTGAGFGYPGAVQRTYTITPAGGSGYTATLRLHYLDAELNGNTEALLDLWRFNGTVWQRVVKTNADTGTGNWIESNAVTQFSPWTLAVGNALTKARLTELKATRHDAGVLVEWKTGYELDNLGFNLYRDVAGRRELVNPSLVAGSALVAGPHVAMTAGNSYSWMDTAPGAANALYWLEEVDLNGRTTTHGPFVASRGLARGVKGVRSPVISQLTDDARPHDGQRQWLPSDASRARLSRVSGKAASAAARERQRWLAARQALKISVRADGWYRVTREQLTAAGLSQSADPTRLQLYADGVEVPIRLTDDGAIEFYGEGLDVASTDARVYWLTEGDTRGLRTDARQSPSVKRLLRGAAGGGAPPVASPLTTYVPVGPPSGDPVFFGYTLERRERAVYFSGLQNGEAENFFGKVVNANASAQTLTVRNLLLDDAPTTTLEVSLQGLTAGEHHVSVAFNGATLGTLDFAGQTRKAAVFAVESYMLHEGDNQVQLVSGGAGDVSLTHYLRLNYRHTMRADGDRLRFSAPAGAVRVGGFSTPNVRAVDVTDPSSPVELQMTEPAAPDARGGWSVRFAAGGEGRRELYAFADTQVSQPASVAANKLSSWSADAGREADLVVVTHGDFAAQVAPLVAQRTAEGMKVEVVDVEDLFDEFSYGAHTPQAVRDFLAWTKANWTKSPSYVLLVGDGSYDPRDYLGRGRYDLVPSKLVDAGAMETASDDWFADFDDDGISDVAVGRLPVRTQTEAANVVGKIVSRTSDPSQVSALLVADRDGADGYSFEAATDGVQNLLPAGTSVARVNRRAQDAATVRSQILAGVNAGPLIVNWMGHGSIDVWTGDGLLRGADTPALVNGNRLPLFVMMTCLNGYYEGTGLDSLAESVLKAEGGGAYAVWASSGMTEPAAQSEANRELYRIIFAEGDAVRLGDAVRRAKAATADRDVRRTWVFFGDPSSRLR